MNKRLLLFTITLTLNLALMNILSNASTIQNINLPCSCDDCTNTNFNKISTEKSHKDRPRFWTDENLKYLTDSQKKQLTSLQEKIKSGVKLTDDEKKQMWYFKDIVVKSKLGDEKFNDFKELLAKKKAGKKLSDSEIARLKSYYNEIKGD